MQLSYGDIVGSTVEENSNVFALIQCTSCCHQQQWAV